MKIKPDTIPQTLIQAIRRQRWTPFIGAGFSKQSNAGAFPSWNELLQRMIVSFNKDDLLPDDGANALKTLLRHNQNLLVAQSLKDRVPIDAYLSFLVSQFDQDKLEAKPSKAHKLLFALSPACIITTNYDGLIENTYAAIYRRAMARVLYNQPGQVRNRLKEWGTFLFKIHGDIGNPKEIILTRTDYSRLEGFENGYKLILSSVFIYTTVLFLGFSLNDPELLGHLERIHEALDREAHPHFALLPEGSFTRQEGIDVRNKYGVKILTYKRQNDHHGLVEFLKNLIQQTKANV